jgi:hypothetical protein
MSSPSNSLTLEVAGVGVAIFCPEPSWLERLKQLYQLFIGTGSPALILQIQLCDHLDPEVMPSDELSFEGQVTTLRSPTYHGFINIQDRTAQICTRAIHPIEDIDYFLRVTYAVLAFQAGGLLFHGAGILHNHKGYLFFGHSGVGKTTVARLSSGDQILNDDLVILMPSQIMPDLTIAQPVGKDAQSWSIHSTPFWNPSQVSPNRLSVKLAAMFQLVQDDYVYLEPLGKGQALAELVASLPVIPMDAHQGLNILDRMESLQKQVPIYNLHFLPDASFWRVINSM